MAKPIVGVYARPCSPVHEAGDDVAHRYVPDPDHAPTCTAVTIYHDDRDWATKRSAPAPDAGALTKVFTCHALDYYGHPLADDAVILELAFFAFNVGDDPAFADPPLAVATEYRALRLRSLSVGDVVTVADRAYRCASSGWEILP